VQGNCLIEPRRTRPEIVVDCVETADVEGKEVLVVCVVDEDTPVLVDDAVVEAEELVTVDVAIVLDEVREDVKVESERIVDVELMLSVTEVEAEDEVIVLDVVGAVELVESVAVVEVVLVSVVDVEEESVAVDDVLVDV